MEQVKKVRNAGSMTEETVKDVIGQLLKGNEAKERWAEYFEELLNVQEDREADIVTVGGVQVPVMERRLLLSYTIILHTLLRGQKEYLQTDERSASRCSPSANDREETSRGFQSCKRRSR